MQNASQKWLKGRNWSGYIYLVALIWREKSRGWPEQPAELASIYVQLAAADASYATGQIYRASGGKGQT